MTHLLALSLLLGCPASDDAETDTDTNESADPIRLRFATYNVSLYRNSAGQLAQDLDSQTLAQGKQIGQTIGEVDPDVILLNEFDYDSAGTSIALLKANFLSADYPYVYVAPSNTGVHSGFDLDNDGNITSAPGSNAYGGDAFGYGQFEGQYAFAVLSKYPIGTPRTYQTFLWRDLPGAWLPEGWFSDEELDVVRLSSKNHVDLPIQVGDATVHFLVSHPTPPVFDGPEDRNGRRNHDEIAFWAKYLDEGAGDDAWPVDDAGLRGGLDGAPFVIAGDLNADPNDGDSSNNPMAMLLTHSRINNTVTPASDGAPEASTAQGGVNGSHTTDPRHDTADFPDQSVGNLRLDYVLPSSELTIVNSGVFWPTSSDDMNAWLSASDHRLVWVELDVPQ